MSEVATAKFKPRVFSGIQPSGGLTLGNYLGAIKKFVAMQEQGIETVYCIVDMHAITVWQDPAALQRQTRELAAGYLAAGLDPAKSILFNQSQVSAHVELGWVFNCVARMGWMNRMTQWKDKTSGKDAEKASLGLFAYPSLMAADILLYHATHVPVGEDQKQHLELTRDIAQKFNNDFSDRIRALDLGVEMQVGDETVHGYFPITEPVIGGPAARIMSLRDGSKKMSKSDPSDYSRINLSDDADAIAQKVRKAKTDAEPLPETAEGLDARPEAKNLVNIYAALADTSVAAVLGDFAGQGFGAFKPKLADLAVASLSPISTEMSRLMQEPAEIDRILGLGADRADAIARPVMDRTYEIVGMVRSRR